MKMKSSKLTTIISGGQNGADLAGLVAAKILGINTGGTAPKGYRVQDYDGNDTLNPTLAEYGLIEHRSSGYKPRTIANVEDSDGTLWVGYTASPGGKLTISTAKRLNKPLIINPFAPDLYKWVEDNNIAVLNVAGNRVSSFNPTIFDTVKQLILDAFDDE